MRNIWNFKRVVIEASCISLKSKCTSCALCYGVRCQKPEFIDFRSGVSTSVPRGTLFTMLRLEIKEENIKWLKPVLEMLGLYPNVLVRSIRVPFF